MQGKCIVCLEDEMQKGLQVFTYEHFNSGSDFFNDQYVWLIEGEVKVLGLHISRIHVLPEDAPILKQNGRDYLDRDWAKKMSYIAS